MSTNLGLICICAPEPENPTVELPFEVQRVEIIFNWISVIRNYNSYEIIIYAINKDIIFVDWLAIKFECKWGWTKKRMFLWAS